jgi:hypothetical protein
VYGRHRFPLRKGLYMLARLRSHLNYANSMATIAVFIAMGGGAYALTIPKDSVGAKQLRENAVRSAEIKRAAVGRSEIGTGAVRSRDVEDASLLAVDFQAGQLPAGPEGPEGPRGLAGTARAYAHVSGNRQRDCPTFSDPSLDEVDCEFTRSKGVSRVHIEREHAGNYSWCVTAPGLDPLTTPAYVVPEIEPPSSPVSTSPMNAGDAVAIPNGACGPNSFTVDTYYRTPQQVRNENNDDTVTVAGIARYAPTADGINVGFNIVIP